jgi:hypothetical protein
MSPYMTTIEEAETARKQALERIRQLDARYPGEPAFESIAQQLEVLDRWWRDPSARTVARERFTFGFLAAKFLPEFDEELSRTLAELARFVERTVG